jgi:diguanylate cyclase (GGDEF)-like protein
VPTAGRKKVPVANSIPDAGTAPRMNVRTIHEIAAVVLGCLSLYISMIHISTPALRGVRWVAISYGGAALGILMREDGQYRLGILLGHLLLGFVCIAFYWGLSQLLYQARLNLWLLLSLIPILVSQGYCLYVAPWVLPPSAVFNATLAFQATCIVALLLRSGTARTRMPRFGLALLFLYWAGLQLYISFSEAVHHAVRTTSYELQVDGRLVLIPVLPSVLMCLGVLWLAVTQLQIELELQSNTDSLTGLLNRRALESAAAREIAHAHRRKSPLALVLIDLDHFKEINDLHGHQGGDAALCVTAECLTKNLRAADLIARIGGEEFVALLPDSDEPQATLTAERIRFELENLGLKHLRKGVSISASFGVTRLLPEDSALEQLLARADQALYHAKKSGRNQVATRWA